MKKVIWFPANSIQKIKLNRRDATRFEHLERYDWILFTSKNTVRFFAAEIRQRQIVIPQSIKIAAVGPETAQALKDAGIKVSLMPKKFSTKHLVSVLGSKIADKRLLFPRSAIAPMDQIRRLRTKGATVDIIHLYTSVPARIPASIVSAFKKGAVDYVVFTSPSAVDSFISLIKKMKTVKENASHARTISAVCIGPSTAHAARAFPFKKIHIAKTSTKAGIVSLLRTLP